MSIEQMLSSVLQQLDVIASQNTALVSKNDELNTRLNDLLAALPVAEKSLLVGVGEAAEMLGISPSTLHRWHEAGEMPPNKSKGKHLRYARTDIERLVNVRRGRPSKHSNAA